MNTFTLAPHVIAGTMHNDIIYGAGAGVFSGTQDEMNLMVQVASLFTEGHTLDGAQKALSHFPKENVIEGFNRLVARGDLITSEPQMAAERYSRNIRYFSLMGSSQPHHAQQTLNRKRVVLIGAGGIGNMIASNLVTAGVSEILLVDADTVETSNLTRQLMFTEEDIGESKVATLATALRSRNSRVGVNFLEMHISRQGDLEGIPAADLWILSADTPHDLVFWVNETCVRRNIPWINVGYVNDIAIWGPLVIPGKTGCHACQKIYAAQIHRDEKCEEAIAKIQKNFKPASSGPINMLASALASRDIMNFLAEVGDVHALNQRIGYHSHNLTIEKQAFTRNEECSTCASR